MEDENSDASANTEVVSNEIVAPSEPMTQSDLVGFLAKKKAANNAKKELVPDATQAVSSETEIEDPLAVSEVEEEDEDDVLSQLSDKGAEKARKRIDKLTRETREAQEELAKFKEAVELEKTNKSDETQEDSDSSQDFGVRLSGIENHEDLYALENEAKQAKKWALSHIGKEFIETEQGEITGDQIREILIKADEALSEQIPKRKQFIEGVQNMEKVAMDTFPEWSDPKSEGFTNMTALLNHETYGPALKELPNRKYVAGLLWKGHQSLMAEQSKNAQKTPELVKETPIQEQRKAPSIPGLTSNIQLTKSPTSSSTKSAAIPDEQMSKNQLATFLSSRRA